MPAESSGWPLRAAGWLQLVLVTAGLAQSLVFLFAFPWEKVSGGPGAMVVHAMAGLYTLAAMGMVLTSVALLRRRRWAWRLSWVAVRLTAVVLVVVPLIGIVEAPHGARLVEPLRMLAWGGPALVLVALLAAARESVD